MINSSRNHVQEHGRGPGLVSEPEAGASLVAGPVSVWLGEKSVPEEGLVSMWCGGVGGAPDNYSGLLRSSPGCVSFMHSLIRVLCATHFL